MYPAPTFIPGLRLSELLYQEAVKPIMATRFPHMVYSAARLDYGSDVLGFDTPRSTDHGWGPKLSLFVSEADHTQCRDAIVETLSEMLPYEIAGYPTNFASPQIDGGWLAPIASGPVNHGVSVSTVRSFSHDYLNVDPAAEISAVDWLLIPEQRLRTLASGKVFYDGLGELEPLRAKLGYYPRDIWLYLLAAQWDRIAQEEPFMARCGDVGDELGSRIIAARLVRELMRLCFLIERTYAPYIKWFGSAFARLRCAASLAPIFEAALQAPGWKEREAQLSRAYEAVAAMHNALALTARLPATVSQFHSRPYLVIHSDQFADAIRAAIVDEQVRWLPPHIGSINQFVDSTDVLDNRDYFNQLRIMYTR
jgi:hypothetical protein